MSKPTTKFTSKYWAHKRLNEDGSESEWVGTCFATEVTLDHALEDAERQAGDSQVVGVKSMTQDEFWGQS